MIVQILIKLRNFDPFIARFIHFIKDITLSLCRSLSLISVIFCVHSIYKIVIYQTAPFVKKLNFHMSKQKKIILENMNYKGTFEFFR